MPLSVVGRAGPFRLMPHYVHWGLTGNGADRGRDGLAPGGHHLPPDTPKAGRQSVRRDARSLPFTFPTRLTESLLTFGLSNCTQVSGRLRAVRLVAIGLFILWRRCLF
ncbi:hypothetical protein [Photorhabdus thracensis]|uniref:hypothetical protein n=2 Tax=Photorhabdus thracensis TaxID=230089 RepID=UPI001E5A296E|nr:hypothetical protein [Photorhabdus thracensis]MCC8423106.1 hypothetical protein [Photorhabdus thracensis]